MLLEKSLNYLPTQTASEVKTSHTRQPKSQPTRPFFKSEAIPNMWFVRVYCSLCGLCPHRVPPAPVVELLGGEVWPRVPALTPTTHTSCLSFITHCFPPLCRRFHLSTLSFLVSLFSRPFCSVSFPFQTNSGRFLSLSCRFCKGTFLFMERESSEPRTTHNISN